MLVYLPKFVTNSIEVRVFSSPEYLHLSLLDPYISIDELKKCMVNASKLFYTAIIVLSLEATYLIVNIFPILIKFYSNEAAHSLSSFEFFGDW